MNQPVRLHFSELRVPLKMTFRHASAARTHGESLWVEASRGAHRGYGEGCPRSYVTGETRASCRQWLSTWQEPIQSNCISVDALRVWLAENAATVDASPSAWCAVECALLDLFARERGQSVEALLGLAPPGGPHVYSAVLGNDAPWKTRFLIDQYCILGLTDFKVKLEGDLEVDRQKLRSIAELTAWHGVTGHRVRVDANNLWAETPDRALDYLRALDCDLFGVEEPVKPRDVELHSRISVSLGRPRHSRREPVYAGRSRALRRRARALHGQPQGLASGRGAPRDCVSSRRCARGAGRSSSARTWARHRC